MKDGKQLVMALLVLSAVLLGILVPGGPIETRDFSHISPLILGTFNTFLTTLGIGSIAFAYFAFKGRPWAFVASAVCGMSYFLVYALDLGRIFPVSPDEMPRALLVIEAIGILVSIPLIYLSIRSMRVSSRADDDPVAEVIMTKGSLLLLTVMVLAGIGIINFATLSAMGK